MSELADALFCDNSNVTKRMAQPPPPIASLSQKDQRALRDILERAAESVSEEDAAEALRDEAPAGASAS